MSSDREIGQLQDEIAEARRSRDLWLSSYEDARRTLEGIRLALKAPPEATPRDLMRLAERIGNAAEVVDRIAVALGMGYPEKPEDVVGYATEMAAALAEAQANHAADGERFYVFDVNDGMCDYLTEQEAREAAERVIENYREDANEDGAWQSGVEQVEYGRLVPIARAERVPCECPPESADDCCDFILKPTAEP